MFDTIITISNTFNGNIVDKRTLITPGYSYKKEEHKGHGLSIVYKTIKKLDGKLAVEQDAKQFKVTATIKKL